MKELYLFSGLGADKHVYNFLDLSDFKLNHVLWIDPLQDESIEDYAKRLLQQIPTEKPTLIGVSFGGMIAVEIGKLIETDKIILISSARTRLDIPFYYRIVGKLQLNKLLPTNLLKQVNSLTFWFFGVKKKEEKDLLRIIMIETNNQFLKWAISKITNWRNEIVPKNVITIHGTNDHVLPFKVADHKVIGGGHLMVVNRAAEISSLIRKLLG